MLKILMLLSFIGTGHSSTIKVLAFDGKSKTIVGEMDREHYVNSIIETKGAFDKQVISGLQNFEDSGRSWKLQRIGVGLRANGEIGFGPYKFGKMLRKRFIYSR